MSIPQALARTEIAERRGELRLMADVVDEVDGELSVRLPQSRRRRRADHISEGFCGVREPELTRVAGMADASHVAALTRALNAQWVDAGELGYDLAYDHIAVVADASPLVDALARHTRREMLKVQVAVDEVWGWLGGPTRLTDGELDGLIAWQRARGGQVAFGEPASGIAGFAASHHQAREARAIALATNQRTVRFADLCLLIAVLRDTQLAKVFIERELGELDRPNDRMRELRATLRAYLEQGQCVSAAAALRGRDRKTIQRQLRIAEELLHRCVRDRADQLLIALRTADILRGSA